MHYCVFFFSSRRRHTRLQGDWSSDVCSSDLEHVSFPASVGLASYDSECRSANDARGRLYRWERNPSFIHRRTKDAGHGPPAPCKLLLWPLHTAVLLSLEMDCRYPFSLWNGDADGEIDASRQ